MIMLWVGPGCPGPIAFGTRFMGAVFLDRPVDVFALAVWSRLTVSTFLVSVDVDDFTSTTHS